MTDSKVQAKTIFITGCSSGIGLAAVRLFLTQGHNVFGTVRSTSNKTEVLKLEEQFPARFKYYIMDNTEEMSVAICAQKFLQDVKSIESKRSEIIDVIVLNAGAAITGSLQSVSWKQYIKMFETNTLGHIKLLQCLLPTMQKAKSGKVILIGTICTYSIFTAISAYGMCKSAMEYMFMSEAMIQKQFGIDFQILRVDSTKTPAGIKQEMGAIDIKEFKEFNTTGEKMSIENLAGGVEPEVTAGLISDMIIGKMTDFCVNPNQKEAAKCLIDPSGNKLLQHFTANNQELLKLLNKN